MNLPDFWGEYLREEERIKRLGAVLYEKERFAKQNQAGLKEPSETQEAFDFQSGINFFRGV